MSSYTQLRQVEQLHRGTIGLAVQAITPELAEGLDLDRGMPAASVMDFALSLFTRSGGDRVVLNVVHDGHVAQLVVPVEERHGSLDLLTDRASQEGSRIRRLAPSASTWMKPCSRLLRTFDCLPAS